MYFSITFTEIELDDLNDPSHWVEQKSRFVWNPNVPPGKFEK
jgi:hypothetical protein